MTRGERERLRAELAGKCAAAMVGTIRNDSDYARLVYIANEVDLKVSGWIARDAVKQADALLAELERTAEDPIKAGGTE